MMEMTLGAIVQARLGSARLPGKVLQPLNGVPMLELLARRLEASELLDVVIVATTTEAEDEGIVNLCEKLGINCFRGSESDVLGRVCEASLAFGIDVQVECTGDNPLVDGRFIDVVLADFLGGAETSRDKVCLGLGGAGLPPGLNFNIYKTRSLTQLSDIYLDQPVMREHVGSNFARHADIFDVYTPDIPPGLQHRHMPTELTVDFPEDQQLVSELLQLCELKWGHQNPTYAQIAEILQRNPELRNINSHVTRKWVLSVSGSPHQ